jgi:dUTPase
MSEIPVFRFALREDLKDDKRFLPTRAEPTATGWDVRSADSLVLKPLEAVRIRLGFRGFCPPGWWYELRPRSSSYAKKNLHALYGVIDETYEGELVFACQYIPNMKYLNHHDNDGLYWNEPDWDAFLSNELKIEFGDAIGQIVPVRRDEMVVQEITNEDYDNACKARAAVRGAGGFGSTGK